MRVRWLFLLIAVSLAACGSHTFAGVVGDPPPPAGDFTLTDQTGADFKLSDLTGKWVLMAYGYTHCPDVCPLTLSILREVKKALGAQADQLAVVFVTIDPERDTVDIMGKYVAHFDPTFKALTGALEQIAAAAKPYNVKFEKAAGTSADYAMKHTAFIYLIDPQFRWHVTFPFGVKSEEIASDLKYLMQVEQK